MTERKKISLSKPAQAEATPNTKPGTQSTADNYRKPPVRGSGSAPRKRMSAAEAAQAREEAAARAAQRQAPQRDDEPARQSRGPGGPGNQGGPRGPRSDRPAPQGQRRDDRGPAAHGDRPARDSRSPYEGQGDRPARDSRGPYQGQRDEQQRAPRADNRGDSRSDARSESRGGARSDNCGDPRRDARPGGRPDRGPGPSFGDRRGPGASQGPRYEPRPDPGLARRDGRRADGLQRPPRNPDAQPAAPAREEDGRIRLSKLMSEKGLASRREADEWIDNGWVRVDGQVVSELGSRVFPDQVITIDAAARSHQAQQVTILINKPIGYVSGQAEDGYEPAVVLITPENRWADDKMPIQLTRGHLRHLAPAGRLDIDSTGMLVLTQDGRVAKALIGEDSGVEKEYLVRVQYMAEPEAQDVSAVVPPEAVEALRFGLELDGRQLKPAQVSWQNEHQLRFVLREGRKRQIRRMCELVGLKVVGLKRVRMGSVNLGKLPLGQWRFLRPDERF